MSRHKPHSPTWPLFKRLLLNYLKPHISKLVVAYIFMIVAALTTAALAKLMEPVINRVFAAKNPWELYTVGAALFMAFLIRGLATYAHSVRMNWIGQRVVATVQQQMLDHLLLSDMTYFHNNASGHLLARMLNDVNILRSTASEVLTSFGKSTLTLFFLVCLMFYQDWRLAMIAFIAFPLGGWFVNRLGRRLRRVSRDAQQQVGLLASNLTQTFQGIRHVKAYGQEAYEGKRVGGIIEQLFKLTTKGFRTSAYATPVTEIFSAVAIVTVIVYGGLQVMEGVRTPGALFSFITAFLLAYEPMKRLGKAQAQLQSGMAAAERIFELLDMQPKIENKADAVTLTSDEARAHPVSFNHVSFAYVANTPALHDVSIMAPAGKTIALVGGSGAGKSTMLNMIPRFYDVTDGSVQIGGHDVRDVTLESLRAQIGIVSQEVILFDATIRDNIAYGRSGASEEDVIAAARAAQAHDFISAMPQGYDTIIGELGVKLSGGQRQRLAIARAILKNAPILLLDEATSALDSESERLVQAALNEARAGRTTIVVAHRLSTIVDADCIYVMEAGRVVESGTHAELLAKNGAYFRLYGATVNDGAAA